MVIDLAALTDVAGRAVGAAAVYIGLLPTLKAVVAGGDDAGLLFAERGVVAVAVGFAGGMTGALKTGLVIATLDGGAIGGNAGVPGAALFGVTIALFVAFDVAVAVIAHLARGAVDIVTVGDTGLVGTCLVRATVAMGLTGGIADSLMAGLVVVTFYAGAVQGGAVFAIAALADVTIRFVITGGITDAAIAHLVVQTVDLRTVAIGVDVFETGVEGVVDADSADTLKAGEAVGIAVAAKEPVIQLQVGVAARKQKSSEDD